MSNRDTVSYIVFEGEMTRMERSNHRLWILCIILTLILVGTNAGWLWYESQWDYVTETVTQEVTQSAESEEGDAVNKFVGGDSYGEVNSDDSNNDN